MNFKIFNEEDNHNGFQYEDGIVIDTIPFNNNPDDIYTEGGLYFSDENDICRYLHYGTYIREVIPQGEIIKEPEGGNMWRCHSLDLKPRKDLRKVSTWKWMIKNKININLGDDNYALLWASIHGHLNIVKLLIKHGINNCVQAIHLADANGHSEITEYLFKEFTGKTIEEHNE